MSPFRPRVSALFPLSPCPLIPILSPCPIAVVLSPFVFPLRTLSGSPRSRPQTLSSRRFSPSSSRASRSAVPSAPPSAASRFPPGKL